MLLCLFSMFSILLVLLDGILHEASVTHGINWPPRPLIAVFGNCLNEFSDVLLSRTPHPCERFSLSLSEGRRVPKP